MSVVNLATRLTERLAASQGSEMVVPTRELGDFLVEGEKQLEQLVIQIKGKERQIASLEDRLEGQRSTIQRLKEQVSRLETSAGAGTRK